jgi:YHS domain-containing protein
LLQKEVNVMAKDPVCGMTVDEKDAFATSTYNGTTYYFCSKHCQIEFEKHPEKFVKDKGTANGHHCC